MKLINADLLIKEISRAPVWTSLSVKEMINEHITYDIVRCKECRYCKRKRGTFKGEPIIFYRCEENNRDVESDDYCSYGEREGE